MENAPTEITLDQLEMYFKSQSLPTIVNLGPGEKIIDSKKFVKSHLQILKGDPPLVVKIPHFERLKKLYNLIKSHEQ